MPDTFYAIGDIHGQIDKLNAILDLIAHDEAKHAVRGATTVFIGDLVDRGPDSRGVIQLLIDGQQNGENWIILRGNHDNMFRLFVEEGALRDGGLRAELTWLHPRLGGLETLASYGVRYEDDFSAEVLHADAKGKVPDSHLGFLAGLPHFHRVGDLYFAHAGIRPGIALEDQAPLDLMWVRDVFHESDADHGALIIHGHTPIEAVTHYGNRVNIDTGAGMGRELSAIVIEEGQVFELTGSGRVPVLPNG